MLRGLVHTDLCTSVEVVVGRPAERLDELTAVLATGSLLVVHTPLVPSGARREAVSFGPASAFSHLVRPE